VKKVKNFVSKFALLALALTSLGPVDSVAQEQKVPTKNEFISLLKTAKKSPEHRRIAAYYQQEAAGLKECQRPLGTGCDLPGKTSVRSS
jgi:hypothetical protein